MINIILSGGAGSRLWPLSRTSLPKQFVRLLDDQSLFQKTLIRNASQCSSAIIITNIEQYYLALDQLNTVKNINDKISKANFILEPIGRNTAPAIALACLSLDANDLVLVTTSDHVIKKQSAYETAIEQAKHFAEKDYLVTFGMQPNYPEIAFGYIEAKGNDVLSFKEKPSLEVAKDYLESGNYYWNSGMFCFKAGVFLKELEKHSPDIFNACINAMQGLNLYDSILKISHSKMLAIPEDSIDYCVMEKSNKVKVIPCDIGWSDLGSYDAIFEEVQKNKENNALLLRGLNASEPVCVNSHNNLIIGRDRQISLIDIDDLLIVDTADALLISKKGSSQKVRKIVEKIKINHPDLTENHVLVHRPWGSYEILNDSYNYKVKRIIVKSGGKLSLQKHFYRNEHWVVVSGTASVTVNDNCFLVKQNESTYIKMGQIHRLENKENFDLVMIEVQVGEYTGEDDIVRIDDVYVRSHEN